MRYIYKKIRKWEYKKLRNYENISEIENILLNIKGDSKKQIHYPERYYLTKSFHKDQLMELTNLRYEISKIDNENARDLARLALLSILLDASTAIREKMERRIISLRSDGLAHELHY